MLSIFSNMQPQGVQTMVLYSPIDWESFNNRKVLFLKINELIGIFKITVNNIPIIPERRPIIKVSALNTLDTSFFLEPKLLKTPISLVRSITDT